MIRKLFSANPARIGRFDGPPTSDAVPASLVDGTPGDLKADLIALLGKENVLHRAIDLVRYASDASPYRLVPQVVVLPRTTDDIVKLFRYCRETGRHATFRAAGTSLNGQSQSDDILIDVRRHWYGGKVEDDGRRVRARPGMILGHVNSLLERHGRRLGPDPASSHACTIGGVIANNAGGMRCTVQKDAYHTVSALTFVTPSGAVIDTSKPDAEKEFALAEPQLAEGLLELRRELLADPALADRTRRKYAIRNTHGLRLCALLDGETPLGIFRRLLVGSEGTLAFIAEAVIETIPAPRVTSVAWIPVPTIDEAIALVPGLVNLGASAVELMVAPALTAAGQAFAETPSYWRTLDPKAAALLVEIGAEDSDSLEATQHQVLELVSAARLIKPVEFTSVAEAVELAWHVREGLLGLVGKNRPEGSTLITEDVCFPPERLAQGAHDVQELLAKHGFIPGVAGHAAHGNLHFTLVADLGDAEGRSRYSAFMTELVDLVVRKHDGSLKAEHGTGRNMAPFVAVRMGREGHRHDVAHKTARRSSRDSGTGRDSDAQSRLHLENLKSFPQIEGVTGSSQCIECGFCEPVCPSRNVTMTPRQRIALRREMVRQKDDSAMLAQLQREYQYDGIETCAGDGTCAIPCPIGINTGALIKEFRARENSPAAEAVALRLARALESGRTLVARELAGSACVFLRVWSEAAHGSCRCRAKCCQPGPPARGARANAACRFRPARNRQERCRGSLFLRMHQPHVRSRSRRGRPLPHLRKPLSLCPDAPVSRCGFRRMSLACAARRRGNRKPIGRGTTTWRKPLPMRCGAGAMEELFPSSSTPPRAPSVSKRMSRRSSKESAKNSTRASRSSTR